MIRIAQYKGKSFASKVIKFVTRGQYSHTAIMLADDEIYEAWQGSNSIRVIKSLSDGHSQGTPVDIYELPSTGLQEKMFTEYLTRQVGKKYDFLGLVSFYFNKSKSNREDRWFCSELFVAACNFADIQLLSNVEPWQVSPTMVTRSPLPKFIRAVITG